MSGSHDIRLFRCGMELLRWIERQCRRTNGIPEIPIELMDIAVVLLERAAGIGSASVVRRMGNEIGRTKATMGFAQAVCAASGLRNAPASMAGASEASN